MRHHLPDAEIILTFDGVRAEQEFRRADYERFIQSALWRADHHYGNILPLICDEHMHQTGMMRRALEHIDTPLLMYVEQDTPLVTDEPIDLDLIAKFVLSGESNCVRLHHEGRIPAEHEHMMHGDDGGFIRTSQWSQRPHVASVAFYRRIMDCHFSAEARSFIEDRMHGVVDEAYRCGGMLGWAQYRVHIYNPGPNLKRSYHTDGRAGEPKWDGSQVF
ncbi:hypothetical protein [Nocardia sp. Marseille-Q1738]